MYHRRNIKSHIIFWTLFIFFGILLNVALHNDMHVTWTLFWKDVKDPFTPIGYGRTIAVCYASLFIFRQFIFRKKYMIAVISVVIMIAFDVLLRYLIEQVFIGPVFDKWQFPKTMPLTQYFVENVFFSALGIFTCFFLKTMDDLYWREVMEKEKNIMELQFLRSQINPHFLFNTFNNLYGLSITDPQKTPDAIIKLSEMMRYMLYESNEEKVSVMKEVSYLRNLISLQELRYDEKTYINLCVEGDLEKYSIAPLLLIAFVENAFKHGEVMDADFPLSIIINLDNGILNFRLTNKISRKNKDQVGGVGLNNVKRRLDLLYQNRYHLSIDNNSGVFKSYLSIKLV